MVRRLPSRRATAAREPLYDTAVHNEIGQLGKEIDDFAKREAAWVNTQAAEDKLLNLPPSKDYSYVDKNGRYKLGDCTRFVAPAVKKEIQPGEKHPVILRAKRMSLWTPELGRYYEGLHPSHNIPLAGTNLDDKRAEIGLAAAEADAAAGLLMLAQSTNASPKEASPSKKTSMRTAKAPVGISRTAREEAFHNRPSIKIPIPDHVKSMLVDDWENVTKNQQLVPLPHPHPVEEILNDYLAFERPRREDGSASLEILEETVAGLRNYFDRCLGRILLYRFERAQYFDFHDQWASGSDCNHKSALDTYGAEHLARLLVSLPELIAQTNMDQQSVNRLREELTMFANWFGRHASKYFVSEYETPGQEYIDQARSV
ncbi:MRG-domain-containing protein [Immersiella caudata]|uniref:Chromatin modification-related protein EAF3 n=1 Tax=Immersiella caudata TaxID=314043 RepID=A0AA40BU60_9PEZI|nr:MRG-domain-containing protein [Immersiella caudata]